MDSPAIQFKKKTNRKVDILLAGEFLATLDLVIMQKFLNGMKSEQGDDQDTKRIKSFLVQANRINIAKAAHPNTYVKLVIPREKEKRDNLIETFKLFSMAGITNYAKMVIILNDKYCGWTNSPLKYFKQANLGTTTFLNYAKEFVDDRLGQKKTVEEVKSRDDEIISKLYPVVEKYGIMTRANKQRLMAAYIRRDGKVPENVLKHNMIIA